VRIPSPYVGHIMLDLPSLSPPLRDTLRCTVSVGSAPFPLCNLLDTERLAYRTLRDEIKREAVSAITRAMARAGTAAGTRAALSANEKTRAYAQPAGIAVNMLQDLLTVSLSQSVRIWEMLPHSGALAMGRVPAGSTVRIGLSVTLLEITLSQNNRGVGALISHATKRVDYVTY